MKMSESVIVNKSPYIYRILYEYVCMTDNCDGE